MPKVDGVPTRGSYRIVCRNVSVNAGDNELVMVDGGEVWEGGLVGGPWAGGGGSGVAGRVYSLKFKGKEIQKN